MTWLRVVVLGFGALNMIHNGALFTLGPVVAEDTIGRQAWGFVRPAEAAGLLVMAFVLLHYRLERPLLWGMLAICGVVLCSRSVRDLQRVRVTPGARAMTG